MFISVVTPISIFKNSLQLVQRKRKNSTELFCSFAGTQTYLNTIYKLKKSQILQTWGVLF
jgi:hypothetical protein